VIDEEMAAPIRETERLFLEKRQRALAQGDEERARPQRRARAAKTEESEAEHGFEDDSFESDPKSDPEDPDYVDDSPEANEKKMRDLVQQVRRI
jgi:hypothetical protein